MQKWITKEILKYLSVEDDILVSMVINSLEEAVFLILIFSKMEVHLIQKIYNYK